MGLRFIFICAKMTAMSKNITILGGGLAGCEAAWQAAERGIRVRLFEMKPKRFSSAHKSEGLAELVCSNSLRSNDPGSAPGLLKEEMRRLGSLLMRAADENSVPAGSALAVDRAAFSGFITETIGNHPNIEIVRCEIDDIPSDVEGGITIIATGPLTSDGLARSIGQLVGDEYLYFYDAISPIIDVESIDFGVAFKGSRYGKGEDDYINCPMDEAAYRRFVEELLGGEKVGVNEVDKEIFFEGCMPIEVMAGRGPETLSFGPMKPVGFVDPKTGERPYAIVQLRQENRAATAYNMVGFQTRLKYPEQKRIFSLIPGLEKARFLRLGSMHRNTYINSPLHLLPSLQMKGHPRLLFAGQITGVEGYIESAAMGILAGINAACLVQGKPPAVPPSTTAMGGLVNHITTSDPKRFQPSNINFGLLPLPEHKGGKKIKKADKRAAQSKRALDAISQWISVLKGGGVTPP